MNPQIVYHLEKTSTTNQKIARKVNELTINWHVTEACNYHCRYCYASWNEHLKCAELHKDTSRTYELLKEIFRFFHPENLSNPLRQELTWKKLRLNIAGGEPLVLGDRLLDIILIAREIGFEISIISNGSLLSQDMIKQLAPNLSCLGISIDSPDPNTNRLIGRHDRGHSLLDIEKLNTSIQLARLINPDIMIKLNTVVNALNAKQDLNALIRQINPDRWKVLKVLPILNDNDEILGCDFERFVGRHSEHMNVMSVENNTDMTESYIMIDPKGRFYQNSMNPEMKGYYYSPSILDNGIEDAFSSISFSSDKFIARYSPIHSEVFA